MSRFTKTGQPIMGQTYVLSQGDLLPPTEVKVVAKFFGHKGNADLIMVTLEEEGGARETFPWPIEASPGAPEIKFETT